jgi:glutamyl-Q tRNA(Asp) synthetase
MTDFVTRFAPSPNGYLHLGHAYSALVGFYATRRHGGRFLLRIEDIDLGRARPEFEAAVYEDLAWLGIEWEEPVRRQSEHFSTYEAAIAELTDDGLTYPCFCTRKEMLAAGATHGPDGLVYPGTCKELSASDVAARVKAGEPYALRLEVERAMARLDAPLFWQEEEEGQVLASPATFGDVVLARKDVRTSYHVSGVVDDALQGITTVTRGRDLYEHTAIHRLLQVLLDLPMPHYHHHALVTDDAGQRLAKSKGSTSLRDLRAAGYTWQDILAALPPLD